MIVAFEEYKLRNAAVGAIFMILLSISEPCGLLKGPNVVMWHVPWSVSCLLLPHCMLYHISCWLATVDSITRETGRSCRTYAADYFGKHMR